MNYLLNVDEIKSKSIEQKILDGCLIERPGWIRMSIHPTMTNQEVEFICEAIKDTAENHEHWSKDYYYNALKNCYEHIESNSEELNITKFWFN